MIWVANHIKAYSILREAKSHIDSLFLPLSSMGFSDKSSVVSWDLVLCSRAIASLCANSLKEWVQGLIFCFEKITMD